MPTIYRSRRARILQNLQRQLETIKVSNGYAQDLYKVSTTVHNWHETPAAETPVVYIVDETTQYVYHSSRLTERTWFIALYGVMKDKDQLQMEELVADIEDCLAKNLTLSFDGVQGPASYVKINQIVTDNQLFAEIEGSQLFKVTLEIKYTACFDNPR